MIGIKEADSHQKDLARTTGMVSNKTRPGHVLTGSAFFQWGGGHRKPDSTPKLLDEME